MAVLMEVEMMVILIVDDGKEKKKKWCGWGRKSSGNKWGLVSDGRYVIVYHSTPNYFILL